MFGKKFEVKMKILVVADGIGEGIYDGAIANAFIDLGHQVKRFTWRHYFYNYQYKKEFKIKTAPSKFDFIKSIYYRVQNKFLIGPALYKINNDLVQTAEDFNPELIFIYRGTHVFKRTIKKIKNASGSKVFGYNNDDPFSEVYPSYFWRFFLESIPEYDHLFCYRHKNIIDLDRIGFNKTSLLRSYYLKNNNYPIAKDNLSDVVFIGHFEDDGRDKSIKSLIENGFKVELYGPHWDKSELYSYFVNYLGRYIEPVFGDSYNEVINDAKIALVFYSKRNHDTYTRRCFEIPATSKLMLAEYTKDMDDNLFKEGVDADYFRDDVELVSKVSFYLNNKNDYDRVSTSGCKRLFRDGHEVVDRAKEILRVYNNEVDY